MMMPVDLERMMPLIRALPESLKPMGIQLQGQIASLSKGERAVAALVGVITPNHNRRERKVWIWGQVAQELISYG